MHPAVLPVTLVLVVFVERLVGSDKFAEAARTEKHMRKKRPDHVSQRCEGTPLLVTSTHPSSSPFLKVPVYILPSGHFNTPLKNNQSRSIIHIGI